MAQPIKRDSFEMIEESAVGAGTGAVRGFVAALTAGAVVGGLIALGFGATTLAGLGIPALIGAAVSGFSIGGIAAAAGAIFGGAKRASAVQADNAKYAAKSREQSMGLEAEKVAIHNNAVMMTQQAMGAQLQQAEGAIRADERQNVMNELQQHASAHEKHEHAHEQHEHHDKPAGHWQKKEDARREVAAAATAHSGPTV